VDRPGGDFVSLQPCELLPGAFPGKQHLPLKFLDCLSAGYYQPTFKLLIYAGLKPRPTADDIGEWVNATNFIEDDAVGILRYLCEDRRFMTYETLDRLFRSTWFPIHGQRVTSRDAHDAGRIPDDLLNDEVFKTWLGLSTPQKTLVPKPPTPPDPKLVLSKLFEWWEAEGKRWTKQYERRLYPGGQRPGVNCEFNQPRTAPELFEHV
jgi:hypothetical protein